MQTMDKDDFKARFLRPGMNSAAMRVINSATAPSFQADFAQFIIGSAVRFSVDCAHVRLLANHYAAWLQCSMDGSHCIHRLIQMDH